MSRQVETSQGSGWVDATTYPALAPIAAATDRIRGELEQLIARGVPWVRFRHEDSIYHTRELSHEEIEAEGRRRLAPVGSDRDHKLFPFFRYRRPFGETTRLCPATAQLLLTVSEMVGAAFACLEPGHHIIPHHGGDPTINKCHLGLIVPQGDCRIRVGDEARGWREGEWIAFDDSCEHEAWNRTDRQRFVLLLDVLKPGCRSSHALFSGGAVDHGA